MDRGEEKSPEGDPRLEGEDLLSCLTDEEKECLKYLLETIDSLDQDEEETADSDHDIGERNSPPGLAERSGRVRSLSEGVKEKAERGHAPSKMKIVKSFSEDGPGFSITVTPHSAPRSPGSHPSHLRKFDTIMRSGVNVQELRARFLQQTSNSSGQDPSRQTSSKQPTPTPARHQLSPRMEALQKLGLLKPNQSHPDPDPAQPTWPPPPEPAQSRRL